MPQFCKMKYISIQKLFLSLSICLMAANTSAQSAYATLHLGYAFPSGSQNMAGISNSDNPGGNNVRSYEQINTSLGKGVNVGGAIGYMFNMHIGAELGLSYLVGGKTKGMHTDNNGSTEYIVSANMFRINPSIVFATGFAKFNPYTKFGVVVGFGSVFYETNDRDNGDVENILSVSDGGTALGVSSALGAIFDMNEKVSLFGEITMMNLTYAPTRNSITKYNRNGVDLLPTMNSRERDTEFVDSYSYDPNNPRPNSIPSLALKEKLPFGSLGLNVGIRINL